MTIKPIGIAHYFYVTYSPRGFANEFSVAVFASKTEAHDFRDKVDNNVNTWTAKTSSPIHLREVKAYKTETVRYYTGETTLTRYQKQVNDPQRGSW